MIPLGIWPGTEAGKTGPASLSGPPWGETDQLPLQRELRVGDFSLFLYSRGETGQVVGNFLNLVQISLYLNIGLRRLVPTLPSVVAKS